MRNVLTLRHIEIRDGSVVETREDSALVKNLGVNVDYFVFIFA